MAQPDWSTATAAEVHGYLKGSNRLDAFMDDLQRYVKEDDTTRRIIFLTAISAWCEHPLNLFLRGPSSTGKTYVTVQTMKYFPKDAVMLLGGLSPTALTHDFGKLVDADGLVFDSNDAPYKDQFKKLDDEGKPTRYINHEAFREARKAWDERIAGSHYEVDLSGKILVFLEAPHADTYMRLRPILSHDAKEISFKFADRPLGGRLRTMHVVLKGWPATIFCTTDTKYIEELATRSLCHTPDMSIIKYSKAVELLGDKVAIPWLFDRYDVHTSRYRKFITDLVNLEVGHSFDGVVLPYARELSRLYKTSLPRDMRDYSKLQNLIEASTLLHYDQRPVLIVQWTDTGGDDIHHGQRRTLVANYQDLYNAAHTFLKIEEATRAGTAGHVITIFYDVIVPLWELTGGKAMTLRKIRASYVNMGLGEPDRKTFYRWIQTLEDIGWVDSMPDPEDRRRKIVFVSKISTESSLFLALDKFGDVFGPEKLKDWISDIVKLVSPKSIRVYENIGKINLEDNIIYSEKDGNEFVWSSDNIALYEQIFGRLFFSGLDLTIFEKEQARRAKISPKTNQDNLEQLEEKENEELRDRGIDDYGDRPPPLRAQMSLITKLCKEFEDEHSTMPTREELFKEKAEPLGFKIIVFHRVLEKCLQDKLLYDDSKGHVGVNQ